MNQRYCNGMIHVIKKGDNLYQLSRKYRIPLALILRANPYVDVYNLQIGQEICIPVARPYPQMGTPRNSEQMDRMEENTERMSGDNTGEAREMDNRDERTENRMDNRMDNRTADNRTVDNRMAENRTMNDDTETYVTDGTRSLGGILREAGINLSDFLERNDLDKVIIAADVVLYLPKKV